MALVVVVSLMAARLRSAAATIGELRDQRERDMATIATGREEALLMSQIAEELARVQAALADAQAALVNVRAERDQARRDADTAHRQRHAFLAGLAHDLRNPLAPLSNGIELLRLTDDNPAGRLRTRGIMERQVGNLLRIADELSDLARLSGAQVTLQSTPLRLSAVFDDLAEQMLPTLDAQGMSLEVSPEAHAAPAMRGDAQRLAQALGYLVNDIVRHAERGTVIQIDCTEVPAGVSLRVGAADDLAAAAGQDAGALEDVSVATLGLGVALAEQVLALHGGQLSARRPPRARRAVFTLGLPIETDAAGAPAEPPMLAAPDAGEPPLTILVADDNVDFSHSFATMLELLGHRVSMVHDGLEALSSLIASPPDIAFLDIGMPSLDGVETVRRVRGQGNSQAVLLVAVTGRGGSEDRTRATEAGFDRYLVKPFPMQDVRDALDAAQAVRSGQPSAATPALARSGAA